LKKGCMYCLEEERDRISRIYVTIKREDPKAVCYPERAYWETTLEISFCPFCGRKLHEEEKR
jgi:hypothetical protein